MNEKRPLFLDTTIQVERIVNENDPDLRPKIDRLLDTSSYLLASSFSRLEFKRVVIQNLALVLSYLCEYRSFLHVLARSTRLRQNRRVSTLVNIAKWVGQQTVGSFTAAQGDNWDQLVADQAETFIRNGIRFIWARFDKSVGTVTDRLECKRATERPTVRPNGKIDATIHEKSCENRKCKNANFVYEQRPFLRRLCQQLENRRNELTGELQEALDELKKAVDDPGRVFNYGRCLSIGDVWIHLEAKVAGVNDFATTNYKESEILCPLFGLRMRPIEENVNRDTRQTATPTT